MVRERHSVNPFIRWRKFIRSGIGLTVSKALKPAYKSVMQRLGFKPQLRDEPKAFTIEALCPLAVRVRRNPDR